MNSLLTLVVLPAAALLVAIGAFWYVVVKRRLASRQLVLSELRPVPAPKAGSTGSRPGY